MSDQDLQCLPMSHNKDARLIHVRAIKNLCQYICLLYSSAVSGRQLPSHRDAKNEKLHKFHILYISRAGNTLIRGMFETYCLFPPGDFKFQVSPKRAYFMPSKYSPWLQMQSLSQCIRFLKASRYADLGTVIGTDEWKIQVTVRTDISAQQGIISISLT